MPEASSQVEAACLVVFFSSVLAHGNGRLVLAEAQQALGLAEFVHHGLLGAIAI